MKKKLAEQTNIHHNSLMKPRLPLTVCLRDHGAFFRSNELGCCISICDDFIAAIHPNKSSFVRRTKPQNVKIELRAKNPKKKGWVKIQADKISGWRRIHCRNREYDAISCVPDVLRNYLGDQQEAWVKITEVYLKFSLDWFQKRIILPT